MDLFTISSRAMVDRFLEDRRHQMSAPFILFTSAYKRAQQLYNSYSVNKNHEGEVQVQNLSQKDQKNYNKIRAARIDGYTKWTKSSAAKDNIDDQIFAERQAALHANAIKIDYLSQILDELRAIRAELVALNRREIMRGSDSDASRR